MPSERDVGLFVIMLFAAVCVIHRWLMRDGDR